MAKVKFYKGTTVPTTSTLSDGSLYFNTSNKNIYLNNKGTLVTYKCNDNYASSSDTDTNHYLLFTDSTLSASKYTNSNLVYNPSTNEFGSSSINATFAGINQKYGLVFSSNDASPYFQYKYLRGYVGMDSTAPKEYPSFGLSIKSGDNSEGTGPYRSNVSLTGTALEMDYYFSTGGSYMRISPYYTQVSGSDKNKDTTFSANTNYYTKYDICLKTYSATSTGSNYYCSASIIIPPTSALDSNDTTYGVSLISSPILYGTSKLAYLQFTSTTKECTSYKLSGYYSFSANLTNSNSLTNPTSYTTMS